MAGSGQPPDALGRLATGGRPPLPGSYPTIHVFQPGGDRTVVTVLNENLLAGRSYLNLFSLDLCPRVGSGPIVGLCFNNLGTLSGQLVAPAPFNFVAGGSAFSFSIPGFPLTFEALSADFTGGLLRSVSPVMRLTMF